MKSPLTVHTPLIVAAGAAKSAATTAASALPAPSNIVPIIQALLMLSAVPILMGFASKSIKSSPYLYRVVFAVAYALNLITVGIPGRFDGQVAAGSGKVEFPWRTVFAPAGWAFAIWGIIYLSETIMVGYVSAIGAPMEVLRRAAPYWAMGNMFQAVWTRLFREQYKQAMWLPMVALALGSASLFVAHGELTSAILPSMKLWEKARLIAIRSPISLHATWLTAASLLNLNAWSALSGCSLGTQVALGFASAYFVSIAGIIISVKRGDPLVALVVAWALAALAYQTKEKCQVPELPNSTVDALVLTEKVLSNILIGTAVAAPTISKVMNLF